MKNPLANLMQQAQKMQENLQKAQEELAALEVQGESGGGLVKVVMNGKKEVKKVSIDESLVRDDRDMLEDLVAAAVNDAVNRVNRLKQEKMSALTGGIELPAGFKLPF
ncbi:MULTISPECIES: YbaB/EbfC family nucleoid-associated protein [Methylocaldum]|jgi:DNA-binding YbaB/EbfC family protein|uniref:YbaB/EbfC family nucleoid-associated protein n=1 Tax=unclassified Methylocaldum TaxID=2622260 RepID=UPI00098AABD3|nr:MULTISPECIES: YbaB/EbfC family nucleoid-associated protein [unclassified Methylocaldum]MBP1148753.1 DNA-binding YbaB/EbfC family protein [Methylocaldum sp. RMAD-M]MVF20779.1 YbaB/EbfC family nucleoid-associated protein [Methylocaldum sp. BRCS4]